MKNFDSVEDLKCYNLERLLNLEKLLLREIKHFVIINDKDEILFRLEELESVNTVLTEKSKNYVKRKNKSK